MGIRAIGIERRYGVPAKKVLRKARELELAEGHPIDATSSFKGHRLTKLLLALGVDLSEDEQLELEADGPEPGDPLPPDFEPRDDTALDMLPLAAAPRHPIYLHEDVLERLGDVGSDRVGPRTTHVLRQLGIQGRTRTTKGTRGAGKGWRRSPLGGNGGNHYYLWWAPRGAPVLANLGDELEQRSIVARIVRHHDETEALDAGDLGRYQPLDRADLVQGDGTLQPPWTEAQQRWARRTEPVRVLEGDPGAGKTTSLHLAMTLRQGERVLYLTFSERLRDRAREDSDLDADRGSAVEFLTLRELVIAIAGDAALDDEGGFIADATKLPRKTLGPWREHLHELYCELRAYAVGAAVPSRKSDLAAAERPLLSPEAYKAKRSDALGEQNVEAALAVLRALNKSDRDVVDRYFGSLGSAFAAGRRLLDDDEALTGLDFARWSEIDRIVVDEVQDLAPVEAAVVVELAARIARAHPERRLPTMLMAGDEGQTIRAAGFAWGWLKDLLRERLGVDPTHDQLTTSLRCPRKVALVLEHTESYYRRLEQAQRPSGSHRREIDETHQGHVRLCRLESEDELGQLLSGLRAVEACAVIELADTGFVADEVRLTPEIVKGLEFDVVVLLDAGRWLERIDAEGQRSREAGKGGTQRALWLRRAVDALRVAVSRTAGDLVFVERPGATARAVELLDELVAAADPARVDLQALLELLVTEEEDADLRLRSLLDRAEDMVEAAPLRAWDLAHTAVGQLGDLTLPDAVADAELRRDVQARALAIGFRLLGQHDRAAASLAGLAQKCEAWARAIGQPALAKAVERLARQPAAGAGPELDHLRGLGVRLAGLVADSELARELPRIVQVLEQRRRESVGRFEALLRAEPMAARGQLSGLATTLETFGVRGPKERADALRAEVAAALRRAGELDAALEAYRTSKTPMHAEIGEIFETKGLYVEAADDFEKAELYTDALRCYRKADDPKEAARMARLARLPEVEKLVAWRSEIGFRIASKPAGDLTFAEKDALRKALEKALA